MAFPVYVNKTNGLRQSPIIVDPKKSLKKWFIYPDSLPTQRFRGFENRDDDTQEYGAFVLGQNVAMSLSQTPTLRDGWEPIGTELSNATPVTRAWIFETWDGVQFELKAYDTSIYYYIYGTSTDYSLLLGGLTANQDFGYGNISTSAEVTAETFFSNGVDGVFRFNGATTNISSSTGNTISIASGTWSGLGFYSTGTRGVLINGTVYTYTGGEGTLTITGVTPDPSGEAVGSLVIQSPQNLNFGSGAFKDLSALQGSVMMAHDGRLHMREETKPAVWEYSKLDNPYDFSTGSADGDGGAKLIEFGGPLNAFGKLNQVAIALKSRIIKTLQFNQTGNKVDSPLYTTLVTTDDKGTTLGATNQKSTFSTPFGLVFTTPDKKMVLLSGITANSQPQYLILSDPIQSIFNQGVHDQATGICVNNFIYYCFKSDSSATFNDTLIRGNMLRQTFDAQGKTLPIMWDTPAVGINANDFTAVFNTSTKKYEVHFHSSLNSNSYRFIDNKTDNTTSFTSTIRTWANNFGIAEHQKRIDECFVEILMLQNTKITASVLYDINGYTGQAEYTLDGNNTSCLIEGAVYNPFGASAFGSEKIGSNPQQTELKRYIFDLEIDPSIRFFNISLQLSGDEENNDFELVRFGYRVAEVIDTMDTKFKIGINNT